MNYVQADVTYLNRFGFRQRLTPAADVHVAFDRDHGRDSFQTLEHFNFADVARMDDEIHAFERRDGLQQEGQVDRLSIVHLAAIGVHVLAQQGDLAHPLRRQFLDFLARGGK